jgi:hypothetical protein
MCIREAPLSALLQAGVGNEAGRGDLNFLKLYHPRLAPATFANSSTSPYTR